MSDVASIMHRKCMAMAQNAANVGPLSVNAGALAMKRAIEASVQSVAPGGRLRGVGRRGAKLGVRYDVRGLTAIIQATGPWQLIERPTRAHDITPKRARARKGRAALGGGLAAAAGGPRPSAHSPGTRGKQPFAKGVEVGQPAAIEVMRTATRDAVLKGFHS